MKLLAVDFDNTLLNNDDYQKNIKYINDFVDLGNFFVIVTGRHINSLLRGLTDANLKYHYLICNDGGIIFDKNLNVIYKKDIPIEIARDIANIYDCSDSLSDWYVDSGLEITRNKNSIANKLIGHIRDFNKANKLLSLIKNKHPEVDGYLSERYINIVERSVNKGVSIKHLIDLLDVKQQDVYTIGDNINDLSMSDYSFNNYRMAKSVPELRGKTKRAYNAVYELILDIIKES